MEPTLWGVRLKLLRSRAHFARLEVELPSVVGGYRVSHYTDAKPHADGHGYGFFFPKIEPLDSDRLALILGDCLYNLRCALDQLVYQLHVLRYNGTVPADVEGRSAFPIREKRPVNRGNCVLTSKWDAIKELPPHQRALIEHLQPYNSGNQPHLDRRRASLLELNTLNNIDKHRRLHVVRRVAQRTAAPVFPLSLGFVASPNLAVAEPGTKVDEWRWKHIPDRYQQSLARQVNMHRVALEEVMDEPLAGGTFPLLEKVHDLQNDVVRVIAPFRTFFAEAGIKRDALRLPTPLPTIIRIDWKSDAAWERELRQLWWESERP
jgi:hypothetical protein